MAAGISEEFVAQLTGCQGRLFAFIRTLIPNPDIAADVLQETNLVLWRKSAEFTPGTDFGAWACRIASFQVMAQRRDAGRERLLFDDELLGQIAAIAQERSGTVDRLNKALRRCLQKLAGTQRNLMQRRYGEAVPVKVLAEEMHRTPNAVSRLLYRTRQSLLECMDKALAEEGTP